MDRHHRHLPAISDMSETADRAIETLELDTDAWLSADLDKLESSWIDAQAANFNSAATSALYRAAHNLAGMADIYGYPAIGRIAAALCRLINTDRSLPDTALIGTYVLACHRLSSQRQTS